MGDKLLISIPSRKRWLQMVFSGLWLVGWAFAEITVLGVFFGGQGFGGLRLVLLVWLAGWTMGGVFVLYSLMWQLAGQEILEITSQSITLKRVVLGIGFPREYAAEYIKDLRISESSRSGWLSWRRASDFWGLERGPIAFDYGARTFRIGSGIDEAEAKQVISAVQQRFSHYGGRRVLE